MDEYHKYQIVVENEVWGEPVIEDLNYEKQYFAIKADKNRSGQLYLLQNHDNMTFQFPDI